MSNKNNYRIVYELGENAEMYFCEKGYRNDVSVIIENNCYEVYFFLASALKYEMTIKGFCSFPGLVILDDVTTDKIEASIEDLFNIGYFKYLAPVAKGQKRFWESIYIVPK